MQVYVGLISPYVRKVCVVAAEKGLPFELVITNPWSPDDAFLAISPFSKIPAIRDGDFTLADSSAIVAYLEAKHPDKPVLPPEPRARGKAVWYDEFADTILAVPVLKVLFNRFVSPKLLKQPGDEALAQQGESELKPILDHLEASVPDSGWLAGETFTLADISVASMLRSLAYAGVTPDTENHPRIGNWYDRVRSQAGWQQIAAIEDAPRKK